MKRLLWMLPFVLGCSDGQLGDNGLVRFSQVVDFAETSDFEAPIAVGKPFFVALQRPDGDIFEDDTFTELTLRVEDNQRQGEDSNFATVFPLGFAQYAVVLRQAGPFRLVAEDNEQFLDGIVIQSQTMAGIRFSQSAQRITFSDLCTVVEQIPGDLDGLIVHPNQEIIVSMVPQTDTGEPMIGLLALTASSAAGLDLDSPLFGQGATPNQLIIRPGSAAPGFTADLTLREVESNIELKVSLGISPDPAEVLCN